MLLLDPTPIGDPTFHRLSNSSIPTLSDTQPFTYNTIKSANEISIEKIKHGQNTISHIDLTNYSNQ